MGTATFILGRAFRGFGGTILGCFVVFSIGSGVFIRVRFGFLTFDAKALLWLAIGSWFALVRRSVRGGDSTSSLPSESSLPSSLSSAYSKSALPPSLSAPSMSYSPFGTGEYISVNACRAQVSKSVGIQYSRILKIEGNTFDELCLTSPGRCSASKG
jgi:hypothetical protein